MSEPAREIAPTALAEATPAVPTSRDAPATGGRPARRSVWRRAALLLIVFVVAGTSPLAVVGRVFNLWTLPTPPDLARSVPLLSALVPSPTAPDLALPRPAWVAVPLAVYAGPAAASAVAHLEPGFPVLLTAHVQAGGLVWDHVTWGGPTPAAGGRGWVRDSLLTSVGGSGPAVGDAGALSPALAAALVPLEPHAGLAVYYPAARQLYLTSASQAYPLGSGARTLLLADLLAQSTGAAPPSADSERQLATGDPATASSAYAQIGGSAGLGAFLSRLGLSGIAADTTDWTQIQATPLALDQFYTVLAGAAPSPDLGELNGSGRAQVLDLVAGAPDALTVDAPGGSSTAGAHAALVVGAGQEQDGWTVNAAGVLTAASGLTYVVAACVRAQPDRAAGERALRGVLAPLATIAAG